MRNDTISLLKETSKIGFNAATRVSAVVLIFLLVSSFYFSVLKTGFIPASFSFQQNFFFFFLLHGFMFMGLWLLSSSILGAYMLYQKKMKFDILALFSTTFFSIGTSILEYIFFFFVTAILLIFK